MCSATRIPLPITLQLQLKYDENAGPVSWGVYHIDSAETIYQESLGENDLPPGTMSSGLSAIVQREYEEDLVSFITLQFSDLKRGTYYFQIRDVSESAVKYVKLTELGEKPRVWVELQGSFGGFYSAYFDVVPKYLTLSNLLEELNKDDPTDPPTEVTDRLGDANATTRLQNITVEIVYDENPMDTSWKLESVNSSNVKE